VSGLRTALGRGGSDPFLSWDWDAASVFSSSSARCLWRSDPRRSAKRTIRYLLDSRFEGRLGREFDALTVPSYRDATALRRRGNTSVHLVRNCVDTDAYADVRAQLPSQQPPRLAFVGSASEPNVHGLRWFLHEVWPSLRRERGAELVIAGRGLDRLTADPQSNDGVTWLGKLMRSHSLSRPTNRLGLTYLVLGGTASLSAGPNRSAIGSRESNRIDQHVLVHSHCEKSPASTT
jgi:hypothetical protein